MAKKNPRKKAPEQGAVRIDQKKKDRVAAILAIVLGLVSVREGGSVLLGLSTPAYYVLPWLVWYNVAMGIASVVAGAGMWTQREWSLAVAVNILTLHGIVFLGLIGMNQFGQTVAMTSIFAMLFRTFIWIVICSLLKWKRQSGAGTA